jgi:hypothetical protein
MTDRAKFEQMLEYLINEDKAKAEELFHELVVAKSREIYENLLDDDIQVEAEEQDEEVEENFDLDTDLEVVEVGADPADDMVSDMEMDSEEGEGDEMDAEGGDEPATKDDVMDIKDALEDLKAEFEAMLAGEKGEEDGAEDEMFGDEEGGEEKKEDFDFESSEESEEGMVREYVEKVAAPSNTAEKSTSPVAGKNDMGGTAGNIAAGSADEKGRPAPATKDLASGNVNVPGSKTATKMAPAKGHGAEKKGAGEVGGTNTKSTLGS